MKCLGMRCRRRPPVGLALATETWLVRLVEAAALESENAFKAAQAEHTRAGIPLVVAQTEKVKADTKLSTANAYKAKKDAAALKVACLPTSRRRHARLFRMRPSCVLS